MHYKLENITEETVKDLSTSEIKKIIAEFSFESDIANADQMSIKIAINSMYGVFANKYFHFFSFALASSITAQGRHTTQSTEKMFNKYFRELWYKDTKIHNEMGLTSVSPIAKPVVVYGDTDSIYYSIDEVYDNVTGWKHKDDKAFGGTKFLIELYERRLNDYLNKFFDKYANLFNTTNMLNLELEKIARAGTFLSKKKYALDIAWTDDKIFFKPGEYISLAGGDVVMSSTPRYVKGKLKTEINWLLGQDSKKLSISEILGRVHNIKEEYFLQDIDVIAKAIRVNDYENKVISDTETLELVKGIPFNVRAAALYNHMLNKKNPKLKAKYPLIKSGDKVKWYRAEIASNEFNTFAYLPNQFPYEFAPAINKEEQFELSVLRPLNAYYEAVGLNPINKNLHVAVKLF